MHNFGLDDLRLVSPRDGWPNQSAMEVARNAGCILEKVKVFDSLKEALHDIHFLYATTARPRDMVKNVITPRITANYIRQNSLNSQKSAIMFGPERTGMNNDDIILADSIVTIPVSDENTSLNLAQAVSVLCYEWFTAGSSNEEPIFKIGKSDFATKSEINLLLEKLENELDKKNFFHPAMRGRMLRNLNNIFTRNNLTSQEVKTLRGVIGSLTGE